MKALKKLTGDTAIYGVSSIVGRFLNWWLNPYWTYIFLNQAEIGRISNVYAYVAFLFVILTYGMETGFFRFASGKNDKDAVFSTTLVSIFSTSFLFVLGVIFFRDNLALSLDLAGRSDFIVIMGITIALDVISTIPFAKLRLQQRPIRFAYIKVINIAINIGLNIFFLTLCPIIERHFPDGTFASIYNKDFGIGFVFLSNLISSVVTLILLVPEMNVRWKFNPQLLWKMLVYSSPILLVGITGTINQHVDKILLPKFLPESADPMKQLGIYVTAAKMAVLLNMFIQAFRFAFEPFFFSQKEDVETKKMYVLIMKYFSIIGIIIFLGMSTFSDLIISINAKQYREGVGVVPIILLANLFMGIYFTLSLWYKLTDKTRYGAYLGILGSVITVAINIALIPILGYYASAIALLACFVIMTVVSYFLGNKYYPLNYDVKNFLIYLGISMVFFGFYWMVRTPESPKYGLAVIINIIFIGIIVFREQKEFRFNFKSDS
ncbi:MAG: lipopolysaccharide biosynthesis protein [Prolixibacteraceae bacterium]